MQVVPIAGTTFYTAHAELASGYKRHEMESPSYADELAEMAGRNCYQAWERKRPETATNAGYLANIINQGHFSVLEHASVTFYVEGVSRSLLTELSRHRHLSFSVESQRYVKYDKEPKVVAPPLIAQEFNTPIRDNGPTEYGWTIGDEFMAATENAFDSYYHIARRFEELGYPKKKALEAARSVLPNATEVKMVVTGNLRAWRDVLGKRYHVAADAEIQAFATEILRHLRQIAPNSFQDFPDDPFGDY